MGTLEGVRDMTASKLISLCKVAIFTLLIAASFQASAGYYIEYQHDPCVDFEACHGGPYYHHARHTRSHYRHHARSHQYRHSTAAISVTYYWSIYPNYQCGDSCAPVAHCGSCCNRCGGGSRESASNPAYDNYYRGGSQPQYRDNEYHSSYYTAYQDKDYDTSTADDTNY
jgi:hypothetical protein